MLLIPLGCLSGSAPELPAPQAEVLLLHHKHHLTTVVSINLGRAPHHNGERENGNYDKATLGFARGYFFCHDQCDVQRVRAHRLFCRPRRHAIALRVRARFDTRHGHVSNSHACLRQKPDSSMSSGNSYRRSNCRFWIVVSFSAFDTPFSRIHNTLFLVRFFGSLRSTRANKIYRSRAKCATVSL